MAEQQKMEVAKFKSAVPAIRNILRRCGVTGMDSMRHVSMYLLSRFLTLENASKLKIPEKFAWETLMSTADKSKELALNQFGIDSDCLIAYFDKLFDTQKFTFEMGKNKAEHCKIMEILNDIKIHDVDITMDILGYVYEEHLEHGSCNPRDLGQFFTNRQICKYMVKLCAPKYKRSGVPESVCDPTMGTAGFLTAYVKHYELVDWDVHQDQVHGWDHDNKVAGYARLNMFLESGGTRFENLHCADSLKGGIGTYDIILANMPFGLKGLKYADCNQAVKELGIDGTKAEPLFLQMMMVSLNPGGRCAVIVPDGMLFNVSKCHNMTRKYLLQNFNLKCVIKMSGKMFTNTGVKTSILLFEKTGDTQKIDFAEIDTGSVVMHVKTMDVSELDSNYSLGIQKYMQSDVSFNFPMVALSEILKPVKGKRYSVSEGNESGEYPLLRSSKDGKVKWMDEYTYEGPYLTVGNGGFANFQCHTKFNASTHTLVYDVVGTTPKYVSYVLQHMAGVVNSTCFSGSGLQNLNIQSFMNLKIPMPPPEVQEEIVEELDNVQESAKLAEALVERLQRQMKMITRIIKGEPASLEKICKAENGKVLADKTEGGYNVMSGGTKYNRTFVKFNREPDTFTISKSGTAGYVKWHTERFWAGDCFTLTGDPERVVDKYLYYYLKLNNHLITEKNTCSTIPHCKWEDIKGIVIPVPSIDAQNVIIDKLEVLDHQIKTLTSSGNSFILDSFLGSA